MTFVTIVKRRCWFAALLTLLAILLLGLPNVPGVS